MGTEQRGASQADLRVTTGILAADVLKSEAIRQNNVQTEVDIALMDASSVEVVEWYYGHDPLHEFDGFMDAVILREGPTTRLARLLELDTKQALHEAGAAILATNVFFPQLATASGRERIRHVVTYAERVIPQHILKKHQTAIGYTDFAALAMHAGRESNPERTYTRLELEQLRVAADLLATASSSAVDVPSNIVVRDGQQEIETTKDQIVRILSLGMYSFVADHGLQSGDEVSQLIGLDALLRHSSLIFNGSRAYLGREGLGPRQREFSELVNALDKIFVKGMDRREGGKRGKYQGKLHELLWYLDAQVYLETTGRKHVGILPASRADDQPRIGYPHANRGYDYILWDNRSHKFLPIQLKSNSSNGLYHPLIRPLNDPQIREIDEKALRDKVAFYRKTVADGFSDSGACDNLLPSVADAIDELESRGRNLDQYIANQYGLQLQPLPRFPRQRRRALERERMKRLRVPKKERVIIDVGS